MQHLELFTVVVIAILLVPFVIWRVKASKKYEIYLPLDEKETEYYDDKTPIFTKYWISNSFYKDYIDKTRMTLHGSKEKFDFSNWGIALKLDVYPDKFVLSSLGGVFVKKRAVELNKIAKIFKNKQVVAFKGSNFNFVANNFSDKQIQELIKLKG